MERTEVFKKWKEYLERTKQSKKWRMIREEDMTVGEYPDMEIRSYKFNCTGVGRLTNGAQFPITKTYEVDMIYSDSADYEGAIKFGKMHGGSYLFSEASLEGDLRFQAWEFLSEEFHMYGASLLDWRVNSYGESKAPLHLKSIYAPIKITMVKKGKKRFATIGYLKIDHLKNDKEEIIFEMEEDKSKEIWKILRWYLIGILAAFVLFICCYLSSI